MAAGKQITMLKRSHVCLAWAISAVVVTTGGLAQDYGTKPKITMDEARPVWSAADRTKAKLPVWPDMPLGALKTHSSDYLCFGPGSKGNPQSNGTYIFRSDLNNFRSCTSDGSITSDPSMHIGAIQPSPDGNNFDRDYAGGGPVYALNTDDSLTGQYDGRSPIVLVYHGEYHWYGPALGQLGGTGLAISKDGGRTFTKLGAILMPHVTEEACRDAHRNAYADGSLVEADAKGEPIGSHVEGKNNPPEVYWYSIFSDPQTFDKRWGFSIARVKRNEALAALRQNKSPQFRKYFDGEWTEPGISGKSSFVVFEQDHYIATPQIHYSPYLKKFVLVYQQDQNSVWMRTASNLFNWSEPVLLHRVGAVDGATGAPKKLFYPSIIGVGEDPNSIGHDFNLFCVTGPVTAQMNVWKHGVLLRKIVSFAD
jgi:hypothetical protein